jgi:uncharacterized protein
LPLASSARDVRDRVELAPPWHTAALVFVIVAVAATGTLFFSYKNASPVAPPTSASRFAAYLPAIAVNAALVIYVCRIGRGRSFLAELIGNGWTNLARASVDLALACAAWLTIELADITVGRLFGSPSGTMRGLLPTTLAERLGWSMLALSAGFGEEVVYRGYLQTQLGARTRPLLGILLQSMLFGLAHSDQGGWAALRVGIYGSGLGLLARFRRSLVPGILCHVCVDLASGLWLR